MKIASVISYCSYHNPFIERCIEEAKKVSNEVIVISSDCFFDGTEDLKLRQWEVASKVDTYSIINFDNLKREEPSRYYHNLLRKIGFSKVVDDFDFVFFIDSDEILDGDLVKLWLKKEVQKGEDYKLAHFWYYRDTCYRANQVEEGAVLVSRETLESPEMDWFGDRERENFSTHWNYMANYQNNVLGHHYSWAGTKDMLMRKVSSWGHNQDNVNWKAMIEDEFSHEFDYTCPFKNYTFTKIKPYVGFEFGE